jgi:SRSO17 transposase
VFLGYASERGYALVDRRLYLPKSWTEDRERCRGAGIADEVEFQTKPALGLNMLKSTLDAGLVAGWVAADEVYGHDSKLRHWLEGRSQAYVLAVACDQRLWQEDRRQSRVDELAAKIPKRSWKRVSAGAGSKGERMYEWALLPWRESEGWEHALLVRRSLEAEPEYAYYFTYAPKQRSVLKTLAQVAGQRWAIESAFQMAKGECGLDQYQVRNWRGWYRHITLSMLALAVLAALRAGEKKTLRGASFLQHTGNPAFAQYRVRQRQALLGTSSSLV